jgi:uncharacterized protein (UPF0333 family)
MAKNQTQSSNVDTDTSASSGQPYIQSNMGGSRGGGSKMIMILLILVIVAVAIIALVFVGLNSSTASTASTRTHSENATTIYLSAAGAQEVFGGTVGSYYTSDIFNLSSPVNISLVAQDPSLYNNVTSGWGTFAATPNGTSYSFLSFAVMQANNTNRMYYTLTSSDALLLQNLTPSTTTGTFDGMNYTYSYAVINTTSNIQLLSGLKKDNIVLVVVYNGYHTLNVTKLINVTANTLP